MKQKLFFLAIALLFNCTKKVQLESSKLEGKIFSITVNEQVASKIVEYTRNSDSNEIQTLIKWLNDNKFGWQGIYHTPVAYGIFISTDGFSIQFIPDLVYLYTETGVLSKPDKKIYSEIKMLLSQSPQ